MRPAEEAGPIRRRDYQTRRGGLYLL